MSDAPDLIFSFVIDNESRFAYEAYHLAASLAKWCGGSFEHIHVQVTPEVNPQTRQLFAGLGCQVHQIERFGDGKHCNKIAQLRALQDRDFEIAVLLDTDMIALADFRQELVRDKIQAKIVDLPNPSCEILTEIATLAGITRLPPKADTDAGAGPTFFGNCNGGFYAVPKQYIQPVLHAWSDWAQWMLRNLEPLKRVGMQIHADQVSMWLALHATRWPFKLLPSNLNYYIHFTGKHIYYDASQPISLLHYHSQSVSSSGILKPNATLTQVEAEAVAQANRQIRASFNSDVFRHAFRTYCQEQC
jgi:hypothetical protein